MRGAVKAPLAQAAALTKGPPRFLHGAPSRCSHLLILVHHTLAAGVEHAEGAQDGFLRVCPWEPGGAR